MDFLKKKCHFILNKYVFYHQLKKLRNIYDRKENISILTSLLSTYTGHQSVGHK